MKVDVIDHQRTLKIPKLAVRKIAQEVVAFEGKCYNEVALHFVSTETICQLHNDYFNDPTPTDCISFPLDESMDQGYQIMGDVFICTETAVAYATQHNLDPYEETTLYVVHGLLHLMGYDDIRSKDAAKMRKVEGKHMSNLRKQGLILKS